ncbi:methionyl-tRNA synthetase [Kibdelosporangium banguiense]|uniref:Methionyl-tRNA synthetase n=1 Tax=Kibdelosporangium banguiense TaxID=1365924 RepID=A0ABS4TRA6_9PSEU|nr:class I tRNA ligase family protein [Kibdelosporangium banguiense]MBP2326480.1 methionyl-tRNA synthetase [Kibdelosporangium banguiense]
MTHPRPAEDDRPVLVLGPNPTPNGGMHLGHMAGPYLAGDVYARYQRARGRKVVFSTGTDDSQTFVLASARRLGTDPQELCRTSTELIREALDAMGISVDGFGPFDETYHATVIDYFRELHAAGKFRLRTVRLPYLERTGEFLVEGMVEGECPVCLTTCRGGLCETCCHPNNFDELINPRSTVDPRDVPTVREATILVLPMEEYREQLTAYHEKWAPYWRPHLVQMVRDVLSRPLLDLPITYPLSWGMAAPFPETPGQVLNAWLELIPAGMYTSSYAAARTGRETTPGQLWLPEEDTRIVHFLGFDNAYFFALAHMALLMAHGDRYIRPESVLTNEFYELESEKFSTSKGHVLSVQDILKEVPRDLVRLYLALTAPEYQRTTFTRAGLAKVVGERLAGPWNRLAETLGKAVANAGGDTISLPVSATGRSLAATMLERFDFHYEMPNYSMNRAAEAILAQITRLGRIAATLDGRGLDEEPDAWGDLFLQVRTLLAVSAPILIDLAAAARQAGGFDGVLAPGAFDVPDVVPFAPPLLPVMPDSAGER